MTDLNLTWAVVNAFNDIKIASFVDKADATAYTDTRNDIAVTWDQGRPWIVVKN